MDALPVRAENGRIRISGELTMQHAEALAPLLLACLPTDGSQAQLDLSEVSEIDTAGLQLLMAAHRETVNRVASLSIVAASQAVRETLTLFRQDVLFAPAASEPEPASEPAANPPARKSRRLKAGKRS